MTSPRSRSIPKGLIGQARYVAKNKIQMLTNQANIFNRGVKNLNSNKKVSKYYVNQYDVPNAQADLMRPIYNGKGENKNFYPEAYIIPLDKKHQRNIQDAAESFKWLARNDIKAQLSQESLRLQGREVSEGYHRCADVSSKTLAGEREPAAAAPM